MKLQFLLTLCAVVERGSFAAAAEQVNLTPSAVSLQMKQMEAYFGQPLFDRSGRTVRVTPFARELTSTVERATSEIEALRHQSSLAPAGRVRLGITESAMTTLLPKAFADLRRRVPGIELHIERGSTPDLLQALRAGRVDASVLIRPLSGGPSRLLWTDLLAEALVLVVPAGMSGNNPESLLRQNLWIRLDRRLVAGQMAARFVDAMVPQRPALVDVPSIDAIVAMVAAGIGVSVLPRLRHEHLDAFAVREVSLGRNAPIRKVAMVRRRTESGHRLIDEVESSLVMAVAQLADRNTV